MNKPSLLNYVAGLGLAAVGAARPACQRPQRFRCPPRAWLLSGALGLFGFFRKRRLEQ